MNLPLIGRLDIKSVILTVLFLMFALPWIMSTIGRRKGGGTAPA